MMAKKAEAPERAETARAADLLERLLTDKEFRKSFRRSPSSAAKKFGLDELAEELSGKGKAMYTLEIRESRSSLAGVMMAAAAEGVDASDLASQVGGGELDTPAALAVNQVLSRATLQAVPVPAELGGNGGAAVEAVAPGGDGAAAVDSALPAPDAGPAVESAVPAGDVGVEGVAAPPVETPPVPAGDAAVEGVVPSAPAGPSVSAPPAGGAPVAFAQAPAQPVPGVDVGPATGRDSGVFAAAEQALEQKQQRAAGRARATLGLQAVQPQGAAAVAQPGVVPADQVVPQQPGAAPGAVVDQAAAGQPPGAAAPFDPDHVGTFHEELTAILNNPHVDLPEAAKQDLMSGDLDPRVLHTLNRLGNSGHDIGLSVIKTGHRQFTSGGSVSNHFVGRGFDIATVDGRPVDPSNLAARDIAEQLAEIPVGQRPTEIGTPWPINAPGFFTDSAHCNHIHIGWDGPCPLELAYATQPSGAAAGAVAAAPVGADPAAVVPAGAVPAGVVPAGAVPAGAVPAAAVPGVVAPGAGAVPPPETAAAGNARDSGVFAAAEEQLAKKQEKAAARGRQTLGLAAAQEQQQPAAAAPVQQVAAAAQPAPVGAGATLGDFLPDGSDTYPGDSAPKEEIAAWMGRQAHKAGLPAELPVMAALVESGLKNVNYGDADSLGYFQMRTSIWDQGEYAGFSQDPQKQLKWFIDHALEVKRQRIAEGRQAELQDPSKFGEWIADIERPAEQYRGRYQLRLQEAAQLLHDRGAVTPPAAAQYLQPSPSPSAPVAPSATAPPISIAPQRAGGVMGEAVAATAPVPAGGGLETMTIDGIPATGSPAALKALETAFSFKGTPYYWGGSDPSTGFDCSGLTQFAYKQAGFDISRVTYTQVNDGVAVEPKIESLQAGDLLFFRDSSGDNHHMGMYIGNGKMIHAPHTGDVVKVSDLNEPYYKEQFFAARRIALPDPSAAPAVAAPQPVVAAAQPAAPQPAVATPVEDAASAPSRREDDIFQAAEEALKKKQKARASVRATVQFLRAIPQQPAAPAAGVVPLPGQPAQVLQAVPSPQPAAAAGTVDPSLMQSPVGATPGGYPGDNAPKEQIAAWMAQRAKALGLPPELPVMASLVESGLKNVNYGDADSLGYFQMRTSIWNQGEYAGYPQDPELQLKWFLDHALAVKKRREELGYTAFETDPNKWGDWVADVERPAEQYRGRYQLRLEEARALLARAGAQ